MAKAKIKSKTGAVITVEGSETEVTNIISQLETSTSVQEAKKERKEKIRAQKDQGRRANASDLVIALKEEGFFNKPKALGEIADAIQAKGYIYPTTTLSGVVLSLVQKRFLGRKKADGKWLYGN